jgi:aconitate hydratase
MAEHIPDARTMISTPLGERAVYSLESLGPLEGMPRSIRVLLESCLRHNGRGIVTSRDVRMLADYRATEVGEAEIPFTPGRVVLQDFTGVPAVVDLAAMRSAITGLTGDEGSAEKVNPLVPCDLVIDHSVQVDAFNCDDAVTINAELEFERNTERYQLLKWGQGSFNNFRVVPPATGIVHQVNLEFLASVVWDHNGELYPDSLVGTDSHTTMINGLGVVGWGVGGIEAEAVMLGQPIYMLVPEVVGARLAGKMPEGATATDLVLCVTELLRSHGVVGKFVEFCGDALDALPLATRATLANMAPEYGATMGFFPVDERTIQYLRLSGRDESLIETVEQYCRLQGLWRDDREIVYSSIVDIDISMIEPALAGPTRPQDRILLRDMKRVWKNDLCERFQHDEPRQVDIQDNGAEYALADGAVVIAAITSCTNTSNPDVMVGAGLVARNARARGLERKPWVKTSLAPGSAVVTEYLERAGLTEDLEAIGFFTVGYGCTTCIGNSGPLPDAIRAGIDGGDLVASAVLSGNRNFEGRISPHIKANYLASPPLVVAYAIAGTVDIDLAVDALGEDRDGNPVYLRDIWPSTQEVQDVVRQSVSRDEFVSQYSDVFRGSDEWRAICTSEGELYEWPMDSTYIKEPPFFKDMTMEVSPIQPIDEARVLGLFGDSVTTDHISPAGSIATDSPAGQWLLEHGVPVSLFNSYGSRRGNDQVMIRGTFANVRVRNQLAPGTEGGFTTDFTDGQVRTVFEASCNYRERGIPLVILAGKDYGMGSSRDWAAKGTMMLGVRAVIAESYERIHRSNLVGMGVLPLQFVEGESAAALGLDGSEVFSFAIDDSLKPRDVVPVRAVKESGTVVQFQARCRIDTPVEIEYYRNGGILQTVLRRMASI